MGNHPTSYGGQNMVGPLRRVLVRRPDQAFAVEDPALWHYTSRPDLAVAQQEHDDLVAILRRAGAEVIEHDEPQGQRADSIFVFDPALITDAGAVILRMGKQLRRGEEAAMAQRLQALDVPILATLEGDALAEGGDMFWLDEKTLAVGLGFRTNAEGIRQLGAALEPLGVTIVPVELPYYTGPEACLHLLSLISLVDHDLAVVYPPLMSTPFWQLLNRRGFRLVEVPERGVRHHGTERAGASARRVPDAGGQPDHQAAAEAAGCEVQTYRGNELSLKAEGGPTCLTRPLLACVSYPSQSKH